jgi:anti-anti-sigma factor
MFASGRLQIDESLDEHEVRLTLAGELDFASQPALLELLCRAIEQRAVVVLDLSQVSFIDSTGLSTLLFAHNEAHRKRRELRISPQLAPAVQRMLDLSGVSELLGLPDV